MTFQPAINAIDPTVPDVKFTYVSAGNESALRDCRRAIRRSHIVAIDTETTGCSIVGTTTLLGIPYGTKCRILSVSTDDGTWVIDCFAIDPSMVVRALHGRKIIAHNWAYDAQFLCQYGFDTKKAKLRDTVILSFLLHCGTKKKNSLGYVMQKYLKIGMDKSFQKSDWSGTLSHEQLLYAASDTSYLVELYHVLWLRICRAGLKKTAALEHKVLYGVLEMQRNGVRVDPALWLEIYRQSKERKIDLDRELKEMVKPRTFGGPWNWRKVADIKAACIRLNIQLPVNPKTGKIQTGKAQLALVDDVFIRLILEWRKCDQIVKTFGPKWLGFISKTDGKVHAGFMQCQPETGRFSCNKPNLQQIPRGKHRHCFLADPGKVIVKADYSGIELRMMAKVADDKNLKKAFAEGLDPHTETAKNVLGKSDPTGEDRTLSKALNFGLLYGCGADKLRLQLAANWGMILPLEKTEEMHKKFFNTYKGIKKFHEQKQRDTSTYYRTPWGRRRLGLVDGATSAFPKKVNTPIQSTSADGMKAAVALMIQRKHQMPVELLMVVHDEFVVQCPKQNATEVAVWLENIMKEAMQPLLDPVQCEVESSWGNSWGKNK